MIFSAFAVAALALTDEAADRRLATLRARYAGVRAAIVRSVFTKAYESEARPAYRLSTVTAFQRPNRISCIVVRNAETTPFLTYVTDGKAFRRVEDGEVTTGEFDPNEALPRAGVALEILALWSGETLLRPGSRLLPHPLVAGTRPVTGPDGRSGWTTLAMPADEIDILIDLKTGLIGSVRVGALPDRLTGTARPLYEFRVQSWDLRPKFPKDLFKIPEEKSDPVKTPLPSTPL